MEIKNKKNLKEIILSILFVAGEGVDKSFILEKFAVSEKELDKVIEELKAEYSEDKGIHIISFKNKIQLASNPQYADYIEEVLSPIREKALTRAALETLAIIAYKQPITKLEIETIRGVNNCDYAVQILSDQNMIEVVGRKDAVGKPLLFGTTENFLKRFNLTDLDQLPDYEELIERIKVIETEEAPKSNSLYNEFKIPDEEELPTFLQGESGLTNVSADEQVEDEFEDDEDEEDDE